MLAFSRQFSGIIHRMKTVIPSVQKAIIPKGLSLEKLIGELTLKDDLIEKKSHVISEQKKRIALLEEYLRLEKCRHYGASSEKSSDQEELFNEAEQLVGEAEQAETEKPAKKHAGGRKGLSDKLPRFQIHLDLSEEEKEGSINTFYSTIKEELDIIPAQVRVLEYLQEKAVFKQDGKQVIKAASQPKPPLGKSIASISLLAYLIVAKYCEAGP